jgi:signal transduction histidine kinase
MNQIVVFNLFFCLVIVVLSIWWCMRAASAVPLLIGIAFALFGVSHTATLLSLTESYYTLLIIIRSAAYILVSLGLLLTTLGIIRRKKAEDDLRRSHEELERRVGERTVELASLNESLREEICTRTAAEEEARLSERRLKDIISFLPDATVAVDEHGVIIAWNRAMEEMTGFRAADMLERGDHEYSLPFYNKRRPMLLDFILRPDLEIEKLYPGVIQRSGDGLIAEITLMRNGRETILWAKAAPLYDTRGNVTGAIESIRDVTDRKRVEEAVRQANRKLNLLSDITRHDINNQILALKTFLRYSADGRAEPSTLRDYVAKEQEAVDAIERQIDFTGQYRDLGVKAPTWQDMGECLRSAALAFPAAALRVSPEVTGMEIYADPMLEKVFHNLFDNSIRHGGEGMTSIRASARISDGTVVITVQDDGRGISVEDGKHLFERGFGRNTGYGLFLSREILSITGIAISETGEPGGGARFEITVPAGLWRRLREI